MQFRAYRKKYEKRARLIVERLTLEEKVRLMSGRASLNEAQGAIRGRLLTHYNESPYQAGGNERFQIPPLSFVDGTRGVVCGRGIFTCFPTAVARGATFDTKLEKRVGIAIAREVLYAGGNFFGGVCVNMPYHPGWGRAQETYGEDGCLLGKMGAALIEGVQSRGVIACVKHFAFNSMENVRHTVNILCDKRTEREVMLPHFQKCIQAGAGAVMCSYNFYRGEKCGQSAYLIRNILKGEWDFDGIVISDFTWGIQDTCLAAKAGMDVEMPNTFYYGDKLKALVEDGEIEENVVDEAALRIVRTLLSHQAKIRKNRMEGWDYNEHRRLAFKCAAEGITLLRNEHGLLPFKSGRKKIVVLGGLADQEITGDQGSSQVYPPYVVTPLQGIVQNAAGAEIIYYGGKNLSHIRRLSESADYIIVVAGNDYVAEGECVEMDLQRKKEYLGGDREKGLRLEDDEIQLIQTVSDVRKDAVLILLGGSMISMEDWYNRVGAILMMYYAGMEGGNALGQILFGKVNPSGKLPFSVAADEKDLPEMNWRAGEQRYEYYHGYTLLDKKDRRPRYPFGYGLSYTEFRLSEYEAQYQDSGIYASVLLENTGDRGGAEVVQMYVGKRSSAVERPKKVLKDFCKKYLKPGRKERITLFCPMEDLAYYDEETGSFVCENGEYEVYVGTSSAEEDLEVKVISVSAFQAGNCALKTT